MATRFAVSWECPCGADDVPDVEATVTREGQGWITEDVSAPQCPYCGYMMPEAEAETLIDRNVSDARAAA